MLNQKGIISFRDPGHIPRYLKNSAVLLVVLNVAQAVPFQMWLGRPLLSDKEDYSQRQLAQKLSVTSEPTYLDTGQG